MCVQIFQARILEWVAISFSRDSSWPRDQTYVFCIDRQILTTCAPGKLSPTPQKQNLSFHFLHSLGEKNMGSKASNKYWLKSLFCCLQAVLLFSCKVVFNSVTSRTVAHQASLFMRFSRQEYWSVLPFPPPGDLPDPGIKLASLAFPALAGGFFYHWATSSGCKKELVPWMDVYLVSALWLELLWFPGCHNE